MANRPSLWIVLMSLMSIAYCGENMIEISSRTSDVKKSAGSSYTIKLSYSVTTSPPKAIIQTEGFAYIIAVSKGQELEIIYPNKNNKIDRVEIYVAAFEGRYEIMQSHYKRYTLEDLPEKAYIYHGTWFPQGSLIAELYLYFHRRNENFTVNANRLFIKVSVDAETMSATLLTFNEDTKVLEKIKSQYDAQKNKIAVVKKNRNLINSDNNKKHLLIGTLECPNTFRRFQIEIGLPTIFKSGKGLLYLPVFIETISEEELIDAGVKFANGETSESIKTKWADIECIDKGISITYDPVNKKIFPEIERI